MFLYQTSDDVMETLSVLSDGAMTYLWYRDIKGRIVVLAKDFKEKHD